MRAFLTAQSSLPASPLPLLACVLAFTASVPAADAPFIEVDPGRLTALRERGTGKPFVAVGLNYFDHQTGWAPKLWQRFDEARVRAQLDLIHGQGYNTLRVFLTFQSFHREPGRLDPEGVAKFRRLLALCRERGLRVIPSGPDHWEGTPDWRHGDAFADEAILKADEAWWRAFADTFKDEPTLLAYDLLNEPAIRWESPAMRAKWNAWLAQEYGSPEQVAAAWGMPVAQVGAAGAIEPPPPRPALNDTRLYDYQRFREWLGDEWTRRHTAAIRAADRNHLVTVGHIQWAVPIYVPGVQHYAGFDMKSNARFVDFVSVHFYPLDPPNPAERPEGVAVNAAYLEALLYLCSVGKPLMIGEFNWYGGGGLQVEGAWQLPERPVEHQVEWCRELLAVSSGRVCGWLNWAFADTPTSRDVTRWSGLWTEDLQLKPWGRVFGEFARDVIARPQAPREYPEYLRGSKFDRKAMLTSTEAAAEYRRTLRERRAAAMKPKSSLGQPGTRS